MDISHFKSLAEQITRNDLKVKSLIQEIFECDTSLEDLRQLNSEVARCISKYKKAMTDLEHFVQSLKDPREINVVESELDGYKSQLEANHRSLRKANSVSNRAIEERARREMFAMSDDIDSSGTAMRKRAGRGMDTETLTKKASGATEELFSISRMMAEQVLLSEQSLNTLVSSSATVTETHEEFKSMGNLMVTSRKLLSKYGRREITDRVLIIFALAFFFASCAYVVMKRLF